mmetsp:Transcript_4296/g.13958  ORF Transcript_4296/g.13958 Transcript_4296/m.13958 type:complete len:203 (-) Transcript_4296:37-645(-)
MASDDAHHLGVVQRTRLDGRVWWWSARRQDVHWLVEHEQDVLGFDVAVDEREVVQEGQRAKDLQTHLAGKRAVKGCVAVATKEVVQGAGGKGEDERSVTADGDGVEEGQAARPCGTVCPGHQRHEGSLHRCRTLVPVDGTNYLDGDGAMFLAVVRNDNASKGSVHEQPFVGVAKLWSERFANRKVILSRLVVGNLTGTGLSR